MAVIDLKEPSNANQMTIWRGIYIDETNRHLLVKRANHCKNNAGLWEYPGGKGWLGESEEDTLKREFYEETGLVIGQRKQLIHTHHHLIPDGEHAGIVQVTLFTTVDVIGGSLRFVSRDHPEGVQLPFDEVTTYTRTPATVAVMKVLGATSTQPSL